MGYSLPQIFRGRISQAAPLTKQSQLTDLRKRFQIFSLGVDTVQSMLKLLLPWLTVIH